MKIRNSLFSSQVPTCHSLNSPFLQPGCCCFWDLLSSAVIILSILFLVRDDSYQHSFLHSQNTRLTHWDCSDTAVSPHLWSTEKSKDLSKAVGRKVNKRRYLPIESLVNVTLFSSGLGCHSLHRK